MKRAEIVLTAILNDGDDYEKCCLRRGADCAALHSRLKPLKNVKAEIHTPILGTPQRNYTMPRLKLTASLFCGKIPKEKQILRILEQNDNHIRA